MYYTIPISKKNRVRLILNIFDHIAPFKYLTDRERDVLVEYINEFYKLKGDLNEKLSEEEITILMFDYNFTREISNNLETSMDVVRNYATRLRKKKFIEGHTLSKNVRALFDRMLLDNEVTFKLDIKE